VRAIADGRPVRLAWQNAIGGRTFEVGDGASRCFVKWSPATSPIDLTDEAVRLSWARAFTPVPKLLAQGADDAGSWLVTAPVPGRSAVDARWMAEPATSVRTIGAGLRAIPGDSVWHGLLRSRLPRSKPVRCLAPTGHDRRRLVS